MDQKEQQKDKNTSKMMDTAGHMDSMYQPIIPAHVASFQQKDTKWKLQVTTPWEAPKRTKNGRSGADGVGITKQIILKRKIIIKE